MKRYKQIVLLLLGALFFFLLGGFTLSKSFRLGSSKPSIQPSSEVKSVVTEAASSLSESNLSKVQKVIDGDTIQLENGQVIRYIGIDTPETKDPRTEIQCYGEEAFEENKKLVEGKMIRLEKDVSETDRYGRLLRYVYIDDPSASSGQVFVNDYLVREGFAHASSYPPDVKYQAQFSASQEEAISMNKGLWLECTTSIEQTAVPSSQPTPTLTNNSNIECSKNSYNCSSFKAQAEAQNVFETCGGISNDIHKLDRDGDGRVCETLP